MHRPEKPIKLSKGFIDYLNIINESVVAELIFELMPNSQTETAKRHFKKPKT